MLIERHWVLHNLDRCDERVSACTRWNMIIIELLCHIWYIQYGRRTRSIVLLTANVGSVDYNGIYIRLWMLALRDSVCGIYAVSAYRIAYKTPTKVLLNYNTLKLHQRKCASLNFRDFGRRSADARCNAQFDRRYALLSTRNTSKAASHPARGPGLSQLRGRYK